MTNATSLSLSSRAQSLLAGDEAAEWDRRLKKTARPCGCKSGAAASVVALVGWPVWVVLSAVPDTMLGFVGAVVLYGMVVIGAGVVGKIVGIVVGRRRHRRLQERLQRVLTRRLAAGSAVSEV
jgi:hypothetical protein